jgi:uncharacterized repeat protein (TIGR02543 family)
MKHTTPTNHGLVLDHPAVSAPNKRLWSRFALASCLVLAATGAAAQTAGTLTVRAWATLAANVGPQMEVRVNGVLVGSTEVRASGYQNYTFPSVNAPAGAKLELVFNNDAFASDGDRNLFVESITVNGTTMASDAPGVVFDRGPGPQAFDGVDVMPGLSTLYWNGALRFNLVSGGTTPPTTPTDTPPAGYSRCASEWETCSFSGSADVVYGALATWTSPRSFTGGTPCTNTVFGDPLRGTFKACYFKPNATTPTPLGLNLTIAGTGGVGFSDGSSCSASCAKTFNSGTTVTLAASPAAGFTFAGWGGACTGTSSTCTVTMDAAKNVSATFSAVVVTRTLNLTIAGTGGVGFSDGSSCASSCSKTFNNGSVVTLAASPASGFTFNGWSGACSGTTTTCSVTMDAAKSVSATFAVSPATLSVAVTGSGTVTSTPSGINCTSNCSAPFAVGSNVTLTAAPATGFTFSGWSGACTGTAACTVTLSASSSVSAAFASASVAGSCPTTNTTVASAGGQQLGLNVSRNSGVAPLAVFFDASGTTATSTARPFHELEYRWGFGDTASGTWAYGAKAGTASRNEAMGPVAAHVFENAGTYPITVSAFNGTSTVTYNCNITVLPADVEFAGNKTICVSAVGNFAGCPTGALRVTSNNPSSAVANNIGAGNKRILFARGETFSVASTIQINRNGPGLIGAFGSGAKPNFVNSGEIGTIALSSMTTPNIADWRIVDLKIDGNGFGGNSVAVYGAGSIKNSLVSRLDIQNFNSGIKFSGSNLDAINNNGFTSPMWDGVFLTDNTVYNLVGTGANGGNGFYVGAWRLAVMGNSIDNNLNGEHGMRSPHSRYSVWQHNTTQRIARAHMTLRSGGQGGSTLTAQLGSGIHYTEKLLASENRFIGGPEPHAFGGTGPTNSSSNGRAREQIWEKNLMIGGAGTNGFIGITGSEVTVRNNVLLMHPGTGWSPFNVGAYDTAYAAAQGIPQPTNIWFYQNTIYYPATSPFWLMQLIGDPLTNSEITVKNNLMYAPNNGAAQDGRDWLWNPNNTTVYRTPLSTNTLIAELQTSPNFTVNPPTNAAHLKPLAGSYVIGRGAAVPVWSDYFGVPINPAARDLGAVKR